MACFSFHAAVISRGAGQSIVGAAAYGAGVKLFDTYYGIMYNYSHRTDVRDCGILLPKNSPQKFLQLPFLLECLNIAERRKDAQMAQSFKVALPLELDPAAQVVLLKDFCQANFTSHGRCVIYAIHNGYHNPEQKPSTIIPVTKRLDNPHAHLLVPFRGVDHLGFRKNKLESRSPDKIAELIKLRASWADFQNQAFERLGLDVRVSHLSLAEQGINRQPTLHIGAAAMAKETSGIPTARGDRYLSIILENAKLCGGNDCIAKALEERNRTRAFIDQKAQQLSLQPISVRDHLHHCQSHEPQEYSPSEQEPTHVRGR